MSKIYNRNGSKKQSARKKPDEHNRYRDVIVNFRVTPTERDLIEARIALSGMAKAEYFIESCLYQKVLVKGNIRSFSAIKMTLQELSEKIERNPDLTQLDPTDAERIRIILQMIDYLFEGR